MSNLSKYINIDSTQISNVSKTDIEHLTEFIRDNINNLKVKDGKFKNRLSYIWFIDNLFKLTTDNEGNYIVPNIAQFKIKNAFFYLYIIDFI
jgi:hypothetical protein